MARTSGFVSLTVGFVLAASAASALSAAGPAPRAAAAIPEGFRILERRCFKCHSGAQALSGLDLRTLVSAAKGGKHGPALVPHQSEKSRLIRMVTGRVKPQMPPTGALPDAEVRALREWIDAGAPYPGAAVGRSDDRWWAFRPVRAPEVPQVRDPWIKNPIDAFLLARMNEAGVRPNPPADRVTFIRRATFDLHGLPPTPEEVEGFVGDRSPGAYERLIDRLLASPRYGERWARHWLDLARYAESEGFKADETRPNAWRYRDYVIRSFNADKPYDRFIREQIAGDELYPGSTEALVATGFNRHWADESNARNIPLRRQEILNDITDTVGSVFLGLTVGCARCHDHKYDPISHKDYYRLQAFFAAVQPRDDLALYPAEAARERERQIAAWDAKTRDVRAALAALEQPYVAKVAALKRMPFTKEVQETIDTPPAQRTPLQWQLFNKVSPQLEMKPADFAQAMKGAEKARYEALQKEMARYEPEKPAALPVAIGVTDIGPHAPKTYMLAVGVYDQRLEEVQPGFPAAVDLRAPAIGPPAATGSTGRRTALANWLAAPENPLTPRVMVNRVWQSHFGRGIAGTASDLGKAGELPTHPELIDWLASEFRSSGWSLKAVHRLMMTSAAYRQSSAFSPTASARDPENLLLWRYRRWRLEGEAVRDAALAVAGELNLKEGGPSVFPELPEGVATRGGWPVTADERERNRRSIYVFVRRNMRYPLFEAFDFPDTHETCARRSVTNTAPQALMLFNSELALKPAQSMAGRVLGEASTPEMRIERAYRLAFSRAPESDERDSALRFLATQGELIRARATRGEPLALPRNPPQGVDPVEGAVLVDFCHTLMNANEFLYVD